SFCSITLLLCISFFLSFTSYISLFFFFFFFNDTATTEIYTLSLHDALPIFTRPGRALGRECSDAFAGRAGRDKPHAPSGLEDRRSEEHTSELQSLAYLVCRLLLEKKKKKKKKKKK